MYSCIITSSPAKHSGRVLAKWCVEKIRSYDCRRLTNRDLSEIRREWKKIWVTSLPESCWWLSVVARQIKKGHHQSLIVIFEHTNWCDRYRKGLKTWMITSVQSCCLNSSIVGRLHNFVIVWLINFLIRFFKDLYIWVYHLIESLWSLSFWLNK